ncbi:MAG: virulence factor [Legionellales bacterium]
MTDSKTTEEAGSKDANWELRKSIMEDDLNDPVALVERVYQIWWHWADFHLYIISPNMDLVSPAVIIPAEPLFNSSEHEFVYPIHDSGSKLSTSKSEEMFSAGKSMCKLFFTIEKMIDIFVERLKAAGIDAETPVQVAFGGHPLGQRKAFESVINLSYNVVVTNYDPGAWGERYLQNVKRISDKGYGYPSEAPRDVYKHSHASSSAEIKR